IASKARVVVDRIPGVPDGLRTDEKGNLYVAADKVSVYALSNNGPAKLLGEVVVGETPSNIAFGDPDMETLYITARTSIYRVRLGVKGALPY
ncbi:MAG: SMP-30/gluconolactonase/LRE family protein, partial [Acidobacteriota bacterium]|nr:SMP-30/gluconolactonase/LRE family protein [Acidobacteriota bacterium]